MNFTPKTHHGFTLTEVLTTVTILVVLGMSVLYGINPMLQFFRGYDARRKDDLYQLRIAFESYYTDYDCYPDGSILNNCGGNQLAPYLNSIPCDPQSNAPYTITTVPAASTCPQRYAIFSTLLAPNEDTLQYPDCPQTMAVSSPNMSYVDIVNACSNKSDLCPIYYGCVQGLCTIVARDSVPACKPYSCFPNCGQGGQVNCTNKNSKGNYVSECK